MKSCEPSNGENRIALRQLLQNRKWRHLWRHNLGSRWKLQKMARENFSIVALYNITKNQDNPIKTVGRDSFLSPKTAKNSIFGGHPAPGVAQPHILGDTTRPRHYTNDARLQVEHSNMLSRGWHVITRTQPEWWHVNRGTTYLNVPRASVLHLFCRMTNYEQVQNLGAVCMTRS